jgi:hypothetical protein
MGEVMEGLKNADHDDIVRECLFPNASRCIQ